EHAVLRAVEIDDVQPRRAERTIASEQLQRLHLITRLRVEVALEQAHTAAVTQIDCRNEQHQFNLRKLASTFAPVLPERSGWNCVPQKLPRRTAAETCAP